MYLESWEVGLGRMGNGDITSWLKALYESRPIRGELFESYLHDAPGEPLPAPHSRRRLSWWALLEMSAELPHTEQPWTPPSVYMGGQGLAVLRLADRYVSLECGAPGGGHGHPDRLNLTVHADGVHWLPDFGTGSYVSRSLFWYRSTLAHNAPRLDGVSQAFVDATAEGFDAGPEWSWARARFGPLSRSIVAGQHYVLDVLELAGREERLLELPWHFAGRGEVRGGRWEEAQLDDEYTSRVERFVPDTAAPTVLQLSADGRSLTVHFVSAGELWRAEGPGRPDRNGRETFYLQRARARNTRFVSVLELGEPGSGVRSVRTNGDLVEIETPLGIERHQFTGREWNIERAQERIALKTITATPRPERLLDLEPPTRPIGMALRVAAPPPLDGTIDGFDTSEPLLLELEDQYRRSDETYPGPDEFSARVCANWDDGALYLMVWVTKPDVVVRPADADPLLLDNEPDEIHSDGVQVYLSESDRDGDAGLQWGYLVVPDGRGSGVRVRGASGTAGRAEDVRGGWHKTNDGYCLTLALRWPEGLLAHVGGRVGFDLIVNEMLPGHERRVGQLVWSGGAGWVWLRGDRQDVSRHGILELVG
jgi:hypothetical protein